MTRFLLLPSILLLGLRVDFSLFESIYMASIAINPLLPGYLAWFCIRAKLAFLSPILQMHL